MKLIAILSFVSGCGLVHINGKPLGGGSGGALPTATTTTTTTGEQLVSAPAAVQSSAHCGKTSKEFYLRPGVSYAAGRGMTPIEVADVTGDKLPDLVTGQPAGVLVNKGDGTFESFVDSAWPWAALANEIAVGDFNGDGKADIVGGGDGSEAHFTYMFGNGDGTFRKGVEFQYAGSSSMAMSTGDFNADGALDLAATTYPGVLVFLNPGDGKLTGGAPYTTTGVGLVTADFTGDGKLDLATYDKENIYVGAGRAGGTFAPAVAIGIRGAGAMEDGLVTADFNGDGKPDLAALGEDGYNSQIVVLTNTGGTAFAATQFKVADQGEARGLAAGDLNGDGKPDLAVSNRKTVLVYLNDGKGKFHEPLTIAAAWQGGGGTMSGEIRIANLDRSGIGSIVLEQDGNGTDGIKLVVFRGSCQ